MNETIDTIYHTNRPALGQRGHDENRMIRTPQDYKGTGTAWLTEIIG